MTQSLPTLLFLESDQTAGLALWKACDRLGITLAVIVLPGSDTFGPAALDDRIEAGSLVAITSPKAAASAAFNRLIEQFVAHQGQDCLHLIARPDADGDAAACLPPVLLTARNDQTSRLEEAAAPKFAASFQDSDGPSVAAAIAPRLRSAGGGGTAPGQVFRRLIASPAWAGTALAASLALSIGLGSWALINQSALKSAESDAVQARLASADLVFMLQDELSVAARSEVITTLEAEIYSLADYGLAAASDDAIANTAHLLNALGQARMQEGQLESALTAYSRAASLTGFLLEQDPADPQRIFDHSQAVFWIGDAALTAGQIDIAAQQFDAYRELADQLVAIDPDNLTYRAEQAYSRVNSGAAALEQSDLRTAQVLFDEAIVRFEDGLVDAGAVPRESLANAYGWSSRASRSLGDLSRALEEIDQEITGRSELVLENPESRSQRRQLANAQQGRLSILLELGRTEEVEDQIDTLAGDLAVLAAEMPDSRPTRRIQLAVLRTRAYLALWDGDLIRAKLLSDRAQADYASGPGATSEDDRHIDGGYYDLMAAEIALASGAYESALAEASSALAKFERGISATGPRFAHLAAAASLIIGEAHADSGRRAEAERAWRRGLSFIASMDVPRALRAQDIQARLLARLGRDGEAQALIASLAQAGYARHDYVAFWNAPEPAATAHNQSPNGEQDG